MTQKKQINDIPPQHIHLLGEHTRLKVNKQGGFIQEFMLNEINENPLSGPKGHFLCLDRWGPATDAEKENGMHWHGEAPHVLWDSDPIQRGSTDQRVAMSCQLPLAGMSVRRVIKLATNAAVMHVSEAVTNENKLGRIFNMVQHPTLATPFLDPSTIVDANASKGFVQDDHAPTPEANPAYWPHVPQDAQQTNATVNLQYLKEDAEPPLASFIFQPDTALGWVTACTPSKGLMIGYVWKTKEYPWLNIWRRAENGHPFARGIEFGTTGLHRPYPELVAKGAIYDTPLGEYIDAGETIEKAYVAFLAKIPADFKGIQKVTQNSSGLTLYEHENSNNAERSIQIECRDTFLC